jgi:uncharacterized repeat protein (TIGR03943 family)
MRFKWLSEYWTGIILLLVIGVASLWLGARGKLHLYIHPRYIIFTVILCALGVGAALAGLAVRDHRPKVMSRASIVTVIAGICCFALCAIMLVLKPVGLTSSAASQRGVGAPNLDIDITSTLIGDLVSPDAAYQRFTLKEWSSLLAQSSDAVPFKDKQANVSGFISPSADNNPDILYLSRFIVTCCAVDARPISVPVYLPGWQQKYQPDQWLEVSGSFIANPAKGQVPIVLESKTLKKIDEPAEPYVY